MGRLHRLSLATVLTIPIFAAGCAPHREVYAWGPGEQTYYVQWEHQTHRDHVDWERRSDAEHRDYWKWRHHHHQ